MSKEEALMFSFIEPGRVSQYYFLTSTMILQESEQYIDMTYRDKDCRTIFDSPDGTWPHREELMRLTLLCMNTSNLGLDSYQNSALGKPPTYTKC